MRYIYLILSRFKQQYMRPSQTHLAKEHIKSHFDSLGKRAFTKQDIKLILTAKSREWNIRNELSVNKFIGHLVDMSLLREVEIESPNYQRSYSRYVWGADIPIFQLGQTLKNNSYYSHQTALYLHGLTDQNIKIVYVNAEQSPKPRGKLSLSQSSIDRAFQNRGRKSKYIFECEGWQICILSGMNTGNLGAEKLSTPEGILLVTNIERTLIDIVVRPSYAGGCAEVLEAFKRAKDKVSVKKLISMLQKIKYVYPYHQAIGFYMQRAGFSDAALDAFKKLSIECDFYLDYAIKEKSFSKEWKIFYPSDL